MNEADQVELVKTWWKRYGTTLMTGLVVVFLVILGWRYWDNRSHKMRYSASNLYDLMLYQIKQGELEPAQSSAQSLMHDYSDQPYAAFAALSLAKLHVRAGHYDAALNALSWAQKHTRSDLVKAIVPIRRSRILAEQGKTEAALAEVESIPAGYSVVYYAQRGNVHRSLGDYAAARSDYQAALKEIGTDNAAHQMLEMALSQIPAK